MCILCNLGVRDLHTSEGLNYVGSASLGRLISESSDAAENKSTSYSISVGDTFSGNLDFSGDRDWVGITLEQGASYIFNLVCFINNISHI